VDGNVEVVYGDNITVIYNDPADDWGNAIRLIDSAVYARTVVNGGHITGNTTWALSGSPYIVTGTVTVDSGVTLTIEPGVTVIFLARLNDQRGPDDPWHIRLIVNGTLNAQGTDTDNIVFTSSSSNPAPYDWSGIRFLEAGSTGTLEYIDIQYAGNGVAFKNCSSCGIRNSTITNSYTGVYLENTPASNYIEDNSFINNLYAGIRCAYCASTITNNTITGNSEGQGIYVYYSGGTSMNLPDPVITGNTISGNGTYGIEFRGCGDSIITNNIITGNGSDGIFIECNDNNVQYYHVITGNTITGNGSGISLNGNIDALINYNNIYGNGSTDMANNTPYEIDCRFNLLRR
jgi:parallel beta-helix repeat protein